MPDPLWQLESVRLGSPHAPRLDDVSVSISTGVTAVLGCSGAGKTSLLNLLVGYERPDAGAVSGGPTTGKHALPLFWAPQDGGLWPHLSAREHLATVLPPGGQGRVDELLAALDLADRAAAHPAEMSMGERSRLAVARALAAKPAVLVLDEPLSHVDTARAGRYWRVIRAHVADAGASLVFATHRPESVIGEAQEVVCLRGGRLIYAGSVEALYWEPRTREQAECLGAVNWLSQEDAGRWLADGASVRSCYRPEHLSVVPDAEGDLTVESSRFRGSVAESELRHEPTGRRRRFCHRAEGGPLRRGMKVVLRVLAVLLLVALVGCGGAEGPALSVSAVRHWPVPPAGPSIPAPRAVAVGPEGRAHVLDTAGRVLVYGPDGEVARRWTMPEAEVGTAEGLCVLRDGRVAVADTHYSRVIVFDRQGRELLRFGREGTGPGEFLYPVAVAADEDGNLFVAEYGSNDRVQKFAPDGELLLEFGGFGTGAEQFQRPSGLAWREGRLYVADAMNSRVQVFAADGRSLGVLGGGQELTFRLPYDVAAGPEGDLYVVEYGAARVSRVTPEGRLVGRFGAVGHGEGQMRTPWGLAVAPGGHILIADTGNRRIVELMP